MRQYAGKKFNKIFISDKEKACENSKHSARKVYQYFIAYKIHIFELKWPNDITPHPTFVFVAFASASEGYSIYHLLLYNIM